jgi:hypothetical protein
MKTPTILKDGYQATKEAKQAKAVELLTSKGIPRNNIIFGEEEVTVMVKRRHPIKYNYWYFGEAKADRIHTLWYLFGKYEAPQNIGSLNY